MISLASKKLDVYFGQCADAIVEYCDKTAKGIRKKSRIEACLNQHFIGLVSSFKELLIASPEKLEQIVAHFNGKSQPDKTSILSNLNLITLYNYYTENNSSYYSFNGAIYNAKTSYEQIRTYTCPYCNEGFTYAFGLKNGGLRRTFEWDHFFPKEKYPFLAVCLYNLVPSCKVCNHIKSASAINTLNPMIAFSTDKCIEFLIDVQKPDFLDNDSSYKIEPLALAGIHRTKMQGNLEVFAISERYNCRKDVVSDIFKKKRLYNHAASRILFKSFHNTLFKTENEFRDLLVGVQMQEPEYHKRPFSKIARDIFVDPKL